MGDGWGALECCGRPCVFMCLCLRNHLSLARGEEEGSKQNNVIEKEFCRELPVIPIGSLQHMVVGAILMLW